MTIQFTCGCGRMLQVSEEHAGRRAKCPACGQAIQIPAAPPVPTLRAAAPAPEAPGGGRFSFHEKLAFAIAGGGILVLAVAIPLFLLRDRGGPMAGTPPAAEQVAAPAGPAEAGPEPQASPATESVAEAPAESDEAPADAEESSAPPALPSPAPQPTPEPKRNAPMWARIILDEGIFPDGTFWDTVENAYHTRGSSAPSEEGATRVAVQVPPHLEAADLKHRFGQPELATADHGITWDCYGPLAFGLEHDQTQYTWFKAPARLFEQGFRAAALAVCELAPAAPEPTADHEPAVEPAEPEPAPSDPTPTPPPEPDAPADDPTSEDATVNAK